MRIVKRASIARGQSTTPPSKPASGDDVVNDIRLLDSG